MKKREADLSDLSENDCTNFTAPAIRYISINFSAYSSLDFILIDPRKDMSELSEKKLKSLRENWEYLKNQNVNKANYICHGKNELPSKKKEIDQELIFES